MDRLAQLLRQIDGRGYPAYKRIKGTYQYDRFALDILHVQGDPFAAPSRIAVRISLSELRLDSKDLEDENRRCGLEDGILRGFVEEFRRTGQRRGSGKSGEWDIHRPGQEILPRTACELSGRELRVLFTIGLPASGRRILGHEANEMLTGELPGMVQEGILSADRKIWLSHADAAEDQHVARELLTQRNWVAFIANGSLLPRASGIDDRPLSEGAVPWQSPRELEEEIVLPNRGAVRGTALGRGVTLICGGGYHGKSTLLQAISRSVYDHVPGDGREGCVTAYDAVSVRAEDGRSVCRVDISPFISNLPNRQDTSRFSTPNASGSTSQAANIVEALEIGATCLIIDEDTSATNFMVRDRRMQELVEADQEPITPFIDRVQGLFHEHGISTLLVVGGAGDYFDGADAVLQMKSYRPEWVTDRAREIAERFPSDRKKEERPALMISGHRIPLRESFNPRRGARAERVRTTRTRSIQFGRDEIDVSLVSQLVDDGQTRSIGDWLLELSRGRADGVKTLAELTSRMEKDAKQARLSATTASGYGDRVMARRFELAAAVNRLRTLNVRG